MILHGLEYPYPFEMSKQFISNPAFKKENRIVLTKSLFFKIASCAMGQKAQGRSSKVTLTHTVSLDHHQLQ